MYRIFDKITRIKMISLCVALLVTASTSNIALRRLDRHNFFWRKNNFSRKVNFKKMDQENETDTSRFKKPEVPVQGTRYIRRSIYSSMEMEEWHRKFGKFSENQNFVQDRMEYPRYGSEPGLVLIFNQERFENGSSKRYGSFKDVEDIITCLSRLGFNVYPEFNFTNLNKDEIFRNIDNILASDLSQVNSLLVFVLTHGENSNFLQSRTASFLADDLWLKFVECRDLKGKPKMFVIQACKGTENTTLSLNKEDTMVVPLSTFSSKRIYPDLLIVYSTMEGKYAYRHNTNGAWLIQELCKNFTAYGRRDDVLSILSRITKCICKNYYDTEQSEFVKQIPVIVSTLSRKFYLNKNKDRNFVLTSMEKQDALLQLARSISEKIVSIHGTEEERGNNKDTTR